MQCFLSSVFLFFLIFFTLGIIPIYIFGPHEDEMLGLILGAILSVGVLVCVWCSVIFVKLENLDKKYLKNKI